MVMAIFIKTGKALRFNEENLKLVNKKDELNKKNAEVISKYREIANLVKNKTFTFTREQRKRRIVRFY